MFPSLTSRIVALGAVVVLALFAFAWLLADATAQTRESFRWVTHSADVIEAMDEAMVALSDAESGQRGYVLTRNPNFVQSFEERIAETRKAMTVVTNLTSDSAIQGARARELGTMIERRIEVMAIPLEQARKGSFEQAQATIAGGEGHELMTAITMRVANFLEREQTLQTMRIEAAEGRIVRVERLVLIGLPIISIMILLVSALIVRGIRYPADRIGKAMNALGGGDRSVRITESMGSREFARLARGYNLMADQLEGAVAEQGRSEEELHVANEELLRSSATLRDRGDVIELLGGMAHRMQASRTDEELAQVIGVFVPRVLPGVAGALYAHNNSRNLLLPIAGWGGLEPLPEGFAPDQCWSLRRGQSHFLTAPGSDIICGHAMGSEEPYHCEPLLAGGEVIGTLYLEGILDTENRFRLTVMAENIASALYNHRLKRGLREQTIRDPLTGLFNRRYMEEVLTMEIARAARSKEPLSLVMCDVDHFKRFNDEFGHDAGDAVLQAVATEMRNRFRDGDVVCRYGGEEFTIIAPGSTAQQLAERVEPVREAISQITLRHGGRALGSTSMSFGIAMWDKSMDRDGASLVQVADAALYRAKREGRNRVTIDRMKAA